MERFTKKLSQEEIEARIRKGLSINAYDINMENIFTDNDKIICDCRTKLGKIEDLEEEIGCPLEVLAKLVLGADVFFENQNGKIEALDEAIELNIDTITNKPCMGNWIPQLPKGVDKLLFCDYKKTWWLKEDKSE